MIRRVTVRDVFATNAFFTIDEESRAGFLVDPGAEADRLAAVAESNGWRIERILLTHGHFDHTAAVAPLCERWGVPFAIHRNGLAYLADPALNLSAPCGRHVVLDGAETFADGDAIRLEANPAYALRVVHTPGHTPDSVVFHIPSDAAALVGDTILDGKPGLTHFPGGDPSALAHSLNRLVSTLPRGTVLCPAHSPPIRLG